MTNSNFFSDGSPFLAHPLLTAERSTHEIDFVESALGLAPPASVLDVGCGFGRHCIELAQRGYEVVGIDPAEAMVAAGRQKAAEAGVAVDFRVGRGEDFIAETPFDAAICLFTSLGQVTHDRDNSGLLRRVHDALKPGGKLLVEVPQRETAVKTLKAADIYGDKQRYTKITRAFNPADHTVSETFHVVSPEETRTFFLQYHLFDREELFTSLAAAGFATSAAYGDYAGTPLAKEHPIMLVVGEKL